MACFTFDTALLRLPGRSVVDGLRAHAGAGPTYDGILAEHAAYAEALETAGLTVFVLDPLEAHPDSVFVEDPALVFTEGAILLRPGAATRTREAQYLGDALIEHFGQVAEISRGHVDGGDILVTPDVVMIGLSQRTDCAGAEALITELGRLGHKGRAVAPPGGALHLKTQATLLDEETMLVTQAAEASGLFARFRQIIVDPREAGAANALRINDRLLVAAQHRRTADRLACEGYDLIAVDTTQIERIDAGLTCMSLRWQQRSPLQ